MGWAYGMADDGREVGYGVEAICEQDGCEVQIDRGLAYACGGWHDPTPHSCGHHFCTAHLFIVDLDGEPGLELAVAQLCAACSAHVEEHSQ